MVAIDLMQFLIVWIFTLLGFSIAQFALIQGVPDDVLDDDSCQSCKEHWYRLLHTVSRCPEHGLS
eukprot:1680378-Rhodomonas_salina.2